MMNRKNLNVASIMWNGVGHKLDRAYDAYQRGYITRSKYSECVSYILSLR
ncbi:hypothetical protein [Paenibacillus agilis]|nr:hypothetical protein [Paenibacillus agilis]